MTQPLFLLIVLYASLITAQQLLMYNITDQRDQAMMLATEANWRRARILNLCK